MATAMSLTSTSGLSVVVLEAEEQLAAHQSGHNTGVIHSGIFYEPGTLKARLCVQGREAMYRFCLENDVAHERCGKTIIAGQESDLRGLDELEQRGRANGLELKRLTSEEIKDYEPHARGVAGIFVPESGIVDYAEVTRAFARMARAAGGTIRMKREFRRFGTNPKHFSSPRPTATCGVALW